MKIVYIWVFSFWLERVVLEPVPAFLFLLLLFCLAMWGSFVAVVLTGSTREKISERSKFDELSGPCGSYGSIRASPMH